MDSRSDDVGSVIVVFDGKGGYGQWIGIVLCVSVFDTVIVRGITHGWWKSSCAVRVL